MKTSKSYQIGSSSLILVLVVTLVVSLLLMSLLSLTVLEAKRSSGTVSSHQAFYAAESAFYDAVWHLKDNPDWSSNEVITIGGATVKRDIGTKDDRLTIDVNASLRGAKKRIFAQQASEEETKKKRIPLDLIFVIDVSGSMENSPINNIKNALKNILVQNAGDLFTNNDRIAIVTFASSASTRVNITPPLSHKDTIKNIINSLKAKGGTNIEDGVYKAELIIKQTFTDGTVDRNGGAKQIIILFSDGVPQTRLDNNFEAIADSPSNDCKRKNTNKLPYDDGVYLFPGDSISYLDKVGDLATDDAIRRAQALSDTKNVEFYSIFFSNVPNSNWGCANLYSAAYGDDASKQLSRELTDDLGRLTLKSIASKESYFKTSADASDIQVMFKEIIDKITNSLFYYEEEAPEADE